MSGTRRTVAGRVAATARIVALGTAAALAVGACIPSTVSAPPRATATPTPIAVATDGPPGASDDPGSASVRVDPALLDLLPAEIDGIPLAADPETAAEIAADGSIAALVDAIAVATAFGPIASDAGTDYVVVTLAHLRPDTFGSAFHRVWRDTFDEAVCEQAGGVDGHAEADIAGHQTFIGTCAGGVRTYHVHLPGSDVLVSLQAAGDGRFGEQVVAGLTE